MWICEYCFTSLSAQSWQYRNRWKLEAVTMPYSYFEWPKGLFIVHSTIGSTVHSSLLNSLEHCICTTSITNIRPDRDSNLVPLGYKPAPVNTNEPPRPPSHLWWSAVNDSVRATWWIDGHTCPYYATHLLNLPIQRWSIPPYIVWIILWQINQSCHKMRHKSFLIWGDWLSCDPLERVTW